MKGLLALCILAMMVNGDRKLERRDLLGTYVHSFGDPGRVLHKEDGSEVHIMPITYSKSTLSLKRWGRFEVQDQLMGQSNWLSFKGRWDLKGDSVILWKGDSREAYFVQENGNLLHSNGAYVYYLEQQ